MVYCLYSHWTLRTILELLSHPAIQPAQVRQVAAGLEESHLPPARAAGAGRGAGTGAAQSGAPGGPQGGPRGASRWRGLGSWQVFMALQVMEGWFWLSCSDSSWFVLLSQGFGSELCPKIGKDINVTLEMIIASSQQLCLGDLGPDMRKYLPRMTFSKSQARPKWPLGSRRFKEELEVLADFGRSLPNIFLRGSCWVHS